MNAPNKQKFIATERVFKNGLISFGRNVWLAIAAIAMMTVTLSVLLTLVVVNATLNKSVNDITDKIDVSVYLKDSSTQTQVQNLSTQLQALPSVKSLNYTSKEQALKNYKALNANNVGLLEAIAETSNPLPASLQIKPNDPNQIQPIKDFLDRPENQALYSSTSYSGSRKQAVDKITNAARFFQQAGIAGIIIFVVVSVLIIFNTIRMAIFNRREELTIMRLLGATTWYIRGPFVVETMVYGVIAAAVSLIFCYSLFSVASSTVEATTLGLLDVGYSKTFFSQHLSAVVGGQLLAGIAIGGISSIIATRRYLKFKTN